jgi:HD-like signal output (HDOD) protein
VSGADVARAVGVDPASTARILSLAAKSGLCGDEGPRSVDQAVAMLGPEVVALTALDFTLWEELPEGARLDSATHLSLWTHSLVTALCARSLAKLSTLASPAQAYLCGLMSHFGQLILVDVATEDFAQLLGEADGRLPSVEQERASLGADHRALGAALLEQWGVAKTVTEVIRLSGEQQPLAEHSDPRVLELTRIVHIADRVCQHWSPAMDEDTLVALLDSFQESLQLSEAEAQALHEALNVEFSVHVPLLTGAQLAGHDCAVLLKAAGERKMTIAASTGRRYAESRMHCRELELERIAMAASVTALPAVAQRFVRGGPYVLSMVGICTLVLGAGSALMFIVLYLMKSALGIDLLTGSHLADLVPFL